ncbi:putative repeat protein (TIGR02543 family) [Anaerobacterium chartisolvens]|uniref:Putative repeat protein (TIGR02543 family) n=1 Tax=Anaerobacterium chartisolvens TaxID=1297424 RepID=A0A369B987_9FIRM|nr:S-layer homology domain-containing protein [Anaerobacterium chartisolvens]RCX17158.1 putative repeat protein (TIGR02543 family) [Anaerobacterium chartisolvens]
MFRVRKAAGNYLIKDKIMAWLIVAAIMLTSVLVLPVPVSAYAFSGGSGTLNDPYRVATSEDLNQVRNYLGSCFKQTADIDLSGYANWTPIGSSVIRFAGTYDGGGYKISNLKITDNYSRVGLFGVANVNSLIINVNLDSVNMTISGMYNYCIGGLAGEVYGSVIKCSASGTVTGADRVGGLVGYNCGLVEGCYADAQVLGTTYIGGLIGSSEEGSIVRRSSSVGAVSATSHSVGGLIGGMVSSHVENSFSSAAVSGTNTYKGGLVGVIINQSTVNNSYSTGAVSGSGPEIIGGLVGLVNSSTVTGSYYDRETSGQSDTGKGIPLDTAQMKQQASYAVWDFATVWQITEDTSYPELLRSSSPFMGLGTAGVPYQVSSAYQLNTVRNYMSACFIQTKDINLSGIDWVPIGNVSNMFYGTYNGNDFTIENLNCSNLQNSVGLFGESAYGSVLTGINLVNITVQGNDNVGGLVGSCNGSVSNCHVSGSVSGIKYVGGVAGFSTRTMYSSSSAAVSGTTDVGGLVGYNGYEINYCYNTGSITGDTNVGGLTGHNIGGIVENSYNTGNVSGSSYVGGLIGLNKKLVRYSYNTGNVTGTTTIGGCIGANEGSNAVIQNIFYNADNITDHSIIGSEPEQGVSKTTSEMKRQSTYTNWDFNTYWKIADSVGYPQLQWEDFRDFAPPELDGAVPASGSSGSVLLINFDEPVQKGTGNITITSQADGSVLNIDAAGSRVAVNNKQVTITLEESLTRGTTYTLTMVEGAFVDTASNNCRAATGYYVPGNLAFAANGGTVSASSTHNDFFTIQKINDGIRHWYWNDGTQWNYDNDWCKVSWPAVQEINRIVLRLPVTSALTEAQRTIGPLTLQYLDGNGVYHDLTTIDSWLTPDTYNGTEIKSFTYYPALNTQAVRVKFSGGNSDGWVYLEELEVYNDRNALVSSQGNQYTVNDGNNTISGGSTVITSDTTVTAFLGNLTKHSGSVWKVVAANVSITSAAQFNEAAGKSHGDSMAAGDKLAVLAGDNTTLNVYSVVIKSISVGSQTVTITEGTAGSVTFSATTENIPNGTAVTVSWCDAGGNAASAPTGLTVGGTNIASGGSTITVTASTAAIAGTYYFKAASNGAVSGVVSVTVVEAPYDVLVSVVSPEDITGVPNGTAKTASALGLPSTLTLVTDDGNVPANVTWDVAGSSYDPDNTAEQTFTVAGTVTLPDGVVNTNGVSLDVSINVTVAEAPSTDKTLVSVISPEDITGVPNGTAKTASALGLTSTLTLVTDDGNVPANVIWDVAGSSYDPDNTAEQTFTVAGTVTLPDGVVNTNGVSLDVSISVTVAEAPSTDKTLVSVISPADITGVPNGTAKTASALGLPSTLTLVTDNGNIPANVTWDVAGSSYDPDNTAEQTFTVAGAVTLPDGVVNTNGVSLDVSISVTVAEAPSTDKTLVSVVSPEDITGVPNGTAKTASALGLPSVLTLVTDDGNVPANVTWDVAGSSYDPDNTAEQTFTVAGTVTLPDGVVNTNGVSLDVSISVTVVEAPYVVTYTVTFSSNGSVYTIKTVNAGDSIGSAAWPADPTRSSYTFGGWFTGENGSGNAFTSSTTLNSDITVYAKWASSGGGYGGGSNTTSTPVTPVTPTYKADVKTGNGTETTLPVTVDKNTGSAFIHIGSEKLPQGRNIITVPSISDINTYYVGIPVLHLSTINVQGTLALNTDTGSITVPSNMLTGVSGISGNTAKISIGQVDKNALLKDVKAATDNRPLIQLMLSIDGKPIEWNNPNAPITVSIPYTPTAEELANPESIIIWYIDGSGKAISVPNGHYDPATGTVTFTTTHFSYYAVGYNNVNFIDVAENAWYSKAVSFIAARGIIPGTEDGYYNPQSELTRGEFLVFMMRAYNIAPDINPTDNFSDAGRTYYTGYLAAAKRLGLAGGVGNNMFAPEKEITRQEMFTLMYNVLKKANKLPQGNSGKSLSSFNDAGQISSWAQEAMSLLVKTGTIGGNAGKLTPVSTATRAQMAQVLYNLLSK